MLTNLRKVGGSVMLALSPAFLEELNLNPGSTVDVVMVGAELVIKPLNRPKYKLNELLAQCDLDAPTSKEDQLWFADSSVGREIL